MWHGDKKAAGYVAHRDRQSERLTYRPPSRAPESLRSPRNSQDGALARLRIGSHMPEPPAKERGR
jgi:hypothetical protein